MLEDTSPLLNYFLYRPQNLTFDRQFSSGEWGKVIDHLMAAGYSFKPVQFDDVGYLYRGISSGVLNVLEKQDIGHFHDSSETNNAEQILQIYFVTNELSDAITASGLYKNQDSAVLVFKSSIFNTALSQGKAAVMEVGDMGVIFNYPFLTQKLKLIDLAYIIVNESIVDKTKLLLPQFANRIFSIPVGEHNTVLSEAQKQLENHGITNAKYQSTNVFPSIKKYRRSSKKGFMELKR